MDQKQTEGLLASGQEKKEKHKPGRVNGKNSKHSAGHVFIYKTLRNEIEEILHQNRDKGAGRDKKVGYKTQEKRDIVVRGFFKELFKLGFKIESVHNIREKHLRAVFEQLEEDGQSPSTIQNKISIMRTFCNWIGKNGMVRESTQYVIDKASVKRSTVVREDKSWVGNGVDVLAKIKEVSGEDPEVGIELELCLAYGLRVWEAMSLKPSAAHEGNFIFVRDGTKGGRSRIVPIENIVQQDVIDRAKAIADQKTGALRRRGRNEEQRKSHFYYILKKCGVTLAKEGITAHGLRHQYMHESYLRLTGVEPPVRGGDTSLIDKHELHVATQKLMERAGHSRSTIGVAYYGSQR